MPWDAPEPTTDSEAEPTIEVSTEPTVEPTAAPETTEAAPAADGAASETPAFDLTTEEGVIAAAAHVDALRKVLDKRQNDGFQAGKLNRDAELRRDMAATERVEGFAREALERHGVELTADDTNLLRTLTKANEDYARIGMARGYVNATLQYLGEAAMPQELEAAIAALEATGDVKAIEGIASSAVQRVADTSRTQALDRLTTDALDALPATHVIAQYINQRIAEGVTEELTAKATEQAQAGRTNPPRVSGAVPGSGGMTAEQARAMTPEQAANLPPEQYAEWRRLFFAASANAA